MRIALIGNCQVQTIAVLAGLMLHEPEVQVLDYSEPGSRSEDTRREFADSLEQSDVILAQTALMSFTNERDLRSRYGGKLITIANFYFRGLFPDSCYIGDFEHRLVDPLHVHSILVLDAFRRGLSEEAAARQFDIDVLGRLGLLNAWTESMEEMHRREANGVVDVAAANLMDDACRRYPAFLTMNHPSVVLMADYLQTVFDFAGITYRPINVLRIIDPLAEHDTTPILDEVAEHLHLPYRVSQRWKINALGRRFVSREEFIAECYKVYSRTEPERLVANSPTDLVRALAADPERAYLVDPDAVCPPVAPASAPSERRRHWSRLLRATFR